MAPSTPVPLVTPPLDSDSHGPQKPVGDDLGAAVVDSFIRTSMRVRWTQGVCYPTGMVTDTKAIIGTIIGTGLVVAGLLSTQIAGVNARIDDVRGDLSAQIAGVHVRVDDVRADIRDMRASMERSDSRLPAVEVAFGKVDQRLLTIERVVIPSPAPDE